MAVETMYDPAKNISCLYCNTADEPFGPLFDGTAAADFLDWIQDRGRDPRDMNDNTLDVWVKTWEAEVEA